MSANKVMKEDSVNSLFVQEEEIKLMTENANAMVTTPENTANTQLVEEEEKKETTELVIVRMDLEVLNV